MTQNELEQGNKLLNDIKNLKAGIARIEEVCQKSEDKAINFELNKTPITSGTSGLAYISGSKELVEGFIEAGKKYLEIELAKLEREFETL